MRDLMVEEEMQVEFASLGKVRKINGLKKVKPYHLEVEEFIKGEMAEEEKK